MTAIGDINTHSSASPRLLLVNFSPGGVSFSPTRSFFGPSHPPLTSSLSQTLVPPPHDPLSCQSRESRPVSSLALCFLHRADGVQEGSETDGGHRRRGGRHSFWPVAAQRVQKDAGKLVKSQHFVPAVLYLLLQRLFLYSTVSAGWDSLQGTSEQDSGMCLLLSPCGFSFLYIGCLPVAVQEASAHLQAFRHWILTCLEMMIKLTYSFLQCDVFLPLSPSPGRFLLFG